MMFRSAVVRANVSRLNSRPPGESLCRKKVCLLYSLQLVVVVEEIMLCGGSLILWIEWVVIVSDFLPDLLFRLPSAHQIRSGGSRVEGPAIRGGEVRGVGNGRGDDESDSG